MKSVYITIVALVIGLVSLAYTFFSKQKEEIAYVDVQYLFNGFEGTKEYKTELEVLNNKHKNILDSLRLDALAFTNARGETDSIAIRKTNYFLRIREEFSRSEAEQTNEFDTKIWTQINQYVLDYGKTKDYKVILGAGTDGNVMYAQDQVNVTEEVLEFMNGKYSGE